MAVFGQKQILANSNDLLLVNFDSISNKRTDWCSIALD